MQFSRAGRETGDRQSRTGVSQMKRQFATLSLFSALAFGIGGCGVLSSLPVVGGLFGGGTEEPLPAEPQPAIPSPMPAGSPTPTPTGTPSPAADGETPAEGEVAEGEVTEGEEGLPEAGTTPALAANGLIPSTDTTARLRAVQLGRQDPFSAVPVAPTVVATGAAALGAGNNTNVPPLPRARQLAAQQEARERAAREQQAARERAAREQQAARERAAREQQAARERAAQRARAQPQPQPMPPAQPLSPQPMPDFEPDLPPLPQPDLARAVRVTGVVQIGGEMRAIVEPPNENSRYVRVGDSLANGQVLVKRIDVNAGPEPVVILEQFGVEVARPVGDGAGADNETQASWQPSGGFRAS